MIDNNDKIVVTISAPVQIGIDEFKQVSISKVFSVERSIKDIFLWVKSQGFENVGINDFKLSEYAGESA